MKLRSAVVWLGGLAALAAVAILTSARAAEAQLKPQAAAPAPAAPFEQAAWATPVNHVDELVLDSLNAHGIRPANPCSDAVFFRRVHLDLLGIIPDPSALDRFLHDGNSNKRAALIDALLQRPEFADYQSLKWCDLLRVKAEFPINLWPDAVEVYHQWVHDAIAQNMPYDQFARALLTSSGSNFRVPPVNFYRAMQGHEPGTVADAVALTLMGVRTASWPGERRAGMAAFFSRILYKPTAEWKEQIVCLDPAPAGPLQATFPDGKTVTIPPRQDPRKVFADWLLAPDNEWFARCVANRVWYWQMGRGIVHEPDDFRPDNPPANPELLDYLARELVDSGYDLRHLYCLVLNSRTYQQSSIAQSTSADADRLFARYVPRRLDAEVLADAMHAFSGWGEGYASRIPEPFTFVPILQPTTDLADGSTTSGFLEQFGRPPRDTGLQSERNSTPSAGQRLFLLNSSDVQNRIARSWRAGQLANAGADQRPGLIRWLYMTMLTREPTPDEVAAVGAYLDAPGADKQQAGEDVIWAIFNSKEFLYRH
jgi:hypothetical protein